MEVPRIARTVIAYAVVFFLPMAAWAQTSSDSTTGSATATKVRSTSGAALAGRDGVAGSATDLFIPRVAIFGFRVFQGQGAAPLFGQTSGLCTLRRLPYTWQGHGRRSHGLAAAPARAQHLE